MGNLSEHFDKAEFVCRCCGKLPVQGMDADLIKKLEILRFSCGGKPMYVNSGYRCAKHNKGVDGARFSQHRYGRAADVKVPEVEPDVVANQAERLFTGLGRYRTFTHVDVRSWKARWDERRWDKQRKHD